VRHCLWPRLTRQAQLPTASQVGQTHSFGGRVDGRAGRLDCAPAVNRQLDSVSLLPLLTKRVLHAILDVTIPSGHLGLSVNGRHGDRRDHRKGCTKYEALEHQTQAHRERKDPGRGKNNRAAAFRLVAGGSPAQTLEACNSPTFSCCVE